MELDIVIWWNWKNGKKLLFEMGLANFFIILTLIYLIFVEDQPDAAFNPYEKLNLNSFIHCTSLLILQFIKWIYAVKSFSWPIYWVIFFTVLLSTFIFTLYRDSKWEKWELWTQKENKRKKFFSLFLLWIHVEAFE